MGERPSYNRCSSSQRSVSAFSESFSCGEFGAFDLDLDEADYEAMAQEAEAKAQERIQQSKSIIDGLLEGEVGICDSGGGGSSARHSPPPPREFGSRGDGGGLAQMKNGRQNRSRRWEPQKIFEDEGEEREKNNLFRQSSKGSEAEASCSKTLVISDEEISNSSNDLKRKESSSSDQDRGNSEASVVGSVGAGKSTYSTSSDGTNKKSGMVLAPTHPGAPNGDSSNDLKRKESSNSDQDRGNSEASVVGSVGAGKSTYSTSSEGMVLAPTHPGAPNGGIHINAPNVTINYIVEQRVESRAPPEGRIGREVNSDVSSDDSSYARWLKNGSGGSLRVGGENNNNIKGHMGRAGKDEDILRPTKEALVQQIIHEDQVPNFIQQSPHDDNVPQYVTSVLAMTTQGGHVAKMDQGKSLDDLNKERVEDFDTSQITMSSCESKKGEQIANSSSVMSASSPHVVNDAEMNASERKSSEKSVTKTVKVAPMPRSNPYDLSELLDSLWSPENPNPLAKPNAASVSKSPARSRSSSTSEESVYTAGVTSFFSPEQGTDVTQVTSNELSKLSQIAEGRISKDQVTSRSDAGMPSTRWSGPASKASSASWGGNKEFYSEGQASRCDAKWEERDSRAQILDLSSNSRSTSWGRAGEGTKASGVSCQKGMEEENGNIATARNPLHSTSGGGELHVQSGKSRSISRGKSLSQERADGGDSAMSNSISKEGGRGSNQEGLRRGQQVSFSNAPQKVSMRKLLETCGSDRDLPVYVDEDDDLSTTTGNDPLVKKTKPGSQMGVISEVVGDGGSVASSVPEYKIDPGVAAFAKSFVDGFSKLEDNKKQTAREDGSDRSAVEEIEAKGNPPKRNSRRRASACGIVENKERSMQHRNSPIMPRSQIRGGNHVQNNTKTRTQGRRQRPTSTKSMKTRPTSQFAHPAMNDNDLDQRNSPHASHTQDQSQRAGRIKSSNPGPPRQSAHQPTMNTNGVDQRNILSLSGLERCPGSGRRPSGGVHDSQIIARISNTEHSRHSDVTVPTANRTYSLGDLLRNEEDIIQDSNVEKILNLKPFDYCMVRRSGGRWSYSIVTEVNKNEMKFVLDKEGSKKKIERHGLFHNVRRIKER